MSSSVTELNCISRYTFSLRRILLQNTQISPLYPKCDCTALCIYRSIKFSSALQWSLTLNVGFEVTGRFTPSFAAQDKTHTTFLLLILTEGMNVVLPNPIFPSGFRGGGKNLRDRKGCPAHDSLELLHNLFQHSMRQETLSRVAEKLRAS
jgi:hypothetical protein